MEVITKFIMKLFDPTIIAALVASILAPKVGLLTYYRQKEYELVRERYLDNGLDLISFQVEHALRIFRHNLARSLDALKFFRDMGDKMPLSVLESGYLNLPSDAFDTSRYNVLEALLGEDCKYFWDLYQFTFAFVGTKNSIFIYDIPSILQAKIQEHEGKRARTFSELHDELQKVSDGMTPSYKLQDELAKLTNVMIRNKFKFQEIQNLRNEMEVRRSVNRIKTAIEKYKDSHSWFQRVHTDEECSK